MTSCGWYCISAICINIYIITYIHPAPAALFLVKPIHQSGHPRIGHCWYRNLHLLDASTTRVFDFIFFKSLPCSTCGLHNHFVQSCWWPMAVGVRILCVNIVTITYSPPAPAALPALRGHTWSYCSYMLMTSCGWYCNHYCYYDLFPSCPCSIRASTISIILVPRVIRLSCVTQLARSPSSLSSCWWVRLSTCTLSPVLPF